jgi:hypothetical protein
VETPSKLSNRETEKPDMRFNPAIWLMGAITPPASIAPISQGRSFLSNPSAFALGADLMVKSEYKNKPTNAPRYRRPAKTIGEKSFSSNLANGELSPNNEADNKMYRIGFLSKYHLRMRSSVNIVLCGSKFFQLTPIVNYDSSNVVR